MDDAVEPPPAPVPLRLLAYAIDVALLAAALGLVQLAIRAAVFGGATPAWVHVGWKLELFVLATISLPAWIYFACCDASASGATLGKRALKLRVARLDGGRLDGVSALLRTAFKLLPWELTHVGLFFPTPVFVDAQATLQRPMFMASTLVVGSWLAMAMLMPRNQGVHDLIARSVVVKAPSR